MKAIRRLLLALLLCIVAPATLIANTQNVYATVKQGSTLNIRSGPGTEYSIVGKIGGGTRVIIKDLDTNSSGWVHISQPDGTEGYVSAKHLKGNYVEEFKSKKEREASIRYKIGKIYENAKDAYLTYVDNLFYKIADYGGISYLILALMIAFSVAIIWLTRHFDPDYKYAWVYYLIYIISILPTIGVHTITVSHKYDFNIFGKLMLLMFLLAPTLLSIHGGWGIRQCGMIDGKHFDNMNFYVGQTLQFPVWIMAISGFWHTILFPIIELTQEFPCHEGGFWRFILGYIIVLIIVQVLLMIGTRLIVPLCLKKAGNSIIHIMTITMWWAMVKIAFNWAYANFNGFGYILILFFGGITLVQCLFITLSDISSSRCPMCHNNDARQTNYTDRGISYETSTSWEDMNSSEITPRNYGATVEDARRLVSTTVAFHKWITEHTCPNCGCKWDLSHSEEVDRSSHDIKHTWNERY